MSPAKRKEPDAAKSAHRGAGDASDRACEQICDDELDFFDPLLEQTLRARPLIVCAECAQCKQFRETARSGRYILKARCAKGHWRRGAEEETCELHRVTERGRRDCPDYESTSDDEISRQAYLENLEEMLPDERHIREADGSYVDKTETMKWDIETT